MLLKGYGVSVMNNVRFGSLTLGENCIILRDDRELHKYKPKTKVPYTVFVTDEPIPNPSMVRYDSAGPTTGSIKVKKTKNPIVTLNILSYLQEWIAPEARKPTKKQIMDALNEYFDDILSNQLANFKANEVSQNVSNKKPISRIQEIFITLWQRTRAFDIYGLEIHVDKERKEVAIYQKGTFVKTA